MTLTWDPEVERWFMAHRGRCSADASVIELSNQQDKRAPITDDLRQLGQRAVAELSMLAGNTFVVSARAKRLPSVALLEPLGVEGFFWKPCLTPACQHTGYQDIVRRPVQVSR